MSVSRTYTSPLREEQAEQTRPSRQQIETVNFAKIDDETDFSEV